jgi:hypothetical protein
MKMYFYTIMSNCHPRVWWPHARAWLEHQAEWTKTLQNLLIILGIGVAIWHVCKMDSIDKRRAAIEAVQSIRQVEFVRAYARLKTVAEHGSPTDQSAAIMDAIYSQGDNERNHNRLIDDVNLVLARFEHIWQLHRDEIADSEVILKGTSPEVREFSKILESESLSQCVPRTLKQRHFDKLLAAVIKRDWKDEREHRL